MREMTSTEVATLVRPHIESRQIEDITLHVDEKRIRLQNDYWRIPIRPSREPKPLFPYYEALADLEQEIQDREDIKITLASGDPIGTERVRTVNRRKRHRIYQFPR